jgi:hypothetical protein
MQELKMEEIEQVGGAVSVSTAAKMTIGLMALAIGSPVVVGVGCASLVVMAFL